MWRLLFKNFIKFKDFWKELLDLKCRFGYKFGFYIRVIRGIIEYYGEVREKIYYKYEKVMGRD